MSLFRLASDDLKKWFAGKMRKPLVIRGTRQVGKSTLVQNFAIESKLDLLEIRRYLPEAPGIILDVGGADETLVGASGHFAVVAYK
jgi:hypothetical protein